MAKIALVAGVYVPHDGISNQVLFQRDVLLQAGHAVKIFAHRVDALIDGAEEVKSSWALQGNPFYESADLVVFHFGIRYELFNALLLVEKKSAERRQKVVVEFHNVTPPEILTGAARALADSSLAQLAIAENADEVWVVSQYNRDVAIASIDIDASLREGMTDTLTILRLGVPPTLARTLRSTNAIESMISICRDHASNVKRWRDGQMALRWCAAGMIEAASQFRRVNGRMHLPALRAALEAETAQKVGPAIHTEEVNAA